MVVWPAQFTTTSVPLTSKGTRLRVMGYVMWLQNAPRLTQVGVVALAVGGIGVVAGGIGAVIYSCVKTGFFS